jgi:small conductance mechanosensitive channel
MSATPPLLDPATASSAAPVEESALEQVLHDPASLLDPSRADYDRLIAELTPTFLAVGARVLGVLVILFVAWLLARWVRRLVRGGLARARLDETIARFLGNLAGWAAIAVGVVVSLGVFGVNTTSFAAVLAALGLAVGLGFQGALANLAAGFMLLVFRPFKVGEFVKVGDEEGEVEEIELYFTRLNTLDRRHVMVPNQQVLDNVIQNYSRNTTIRVDVPIGVDYTADPRQTRAVLEDAIRRTAGLTEGSPHAVVLVGFGDSSVDWEVRVHCDWRDRLAVRERVHTAIWDALAEAKITIPFPQRDVHLDLLGGEPLRVRVVTSDSDRRVPTA